MESILITGPLLWGPLCCSAGHKQYRTAQYSVTNDPEPGHQSGDDDTEGFTDDNDNNEVLTAMGPGAIKT